LSLREEAREQSDLNKANYLIKTGILNPNMSTYIISSNQLTFEGETYTSDAFQAMLDAFGVTEIEIREVNKEVYTNNGIDSYSLVGTVSLFSKEIESAELYLDFQNADSFEFQFTANLPSFGFDLISRLGLIPNLKIFDLVEILSLDFPETELIFDSKKQEFYFGLEESEHTLSLLSSNGISLEKIGFELIRNYVDNQAAMLMYTSVKLGDMELDTSINVPIGESLSPKLWRLGIDAPVNLSAGMVGLIDFADQALGGELKKLSFFSSDSYQNTLSAIPTFFLKELEILFSPSPPTLSYLSFDLQTVEVFELASGFFSLERVGLRGFMSIGGSDNVRYNMTLYGEMRLNDQSKVDISVLIPSDAEEEWVFDMDANIDFADINHVSNLPLNTSTDELALPPGFFEVDDLRIKLFEVRFVPAQVKVTDINLYVQVNGSCNLRENLSIQNPALSFDLNDPFNQDGNRSLVGEISGTIQIESIAFLMSASKLENGWSFSGEMTKGNIEVGDVISSLASHFGIEIPDFLHDFNIQELSLAFSTSTDAEAGESEDDLPIGQRSEKEIIFSCLGYFDNQEDSVQIDIRIIKKQDGVETSFDAKFDLIIIHDDLRLAFELNIASGGNGRTVVGSYYGDLTLNIGEFLAVILRDSSLSEEIDLEIDLNDIILVFDKQTGQSAKYLLALDLALDINLSNLPLVGKVFPSNQQIGVEDIQFWIASTAFSQDEVASFQQQLPPDITPLPNKDLGKGLGFSVMMNFGGSPQILTIPVSSSSTENPVNPGNTLAPGTSESATLAPTPTDNTKWFTVQKSFGPVYFNRVGVLYQDGDLWFKLDASLTAAGLTLSLDGLGVGSSLSEFDPQFQLNGLGIDFQKGPLEIGGAFLKYGDHEFDGIAIIKTAALSLTAIGMYATVDNHKSLFLYAILDYPLGGPSFFFVTGLAAGFGYNRSLTVPPIDKLDKFPLISEAVNGAAPLPAMGGSPEARTSLTSKLDMLRQYIPVDVGEYFLAVGIKFTSFKLIDSFALLIVSFGNRFELDIMGISTVVAPPAVPGESIDPVAEVQMVFSVRFIPDEGALLVDARLTSASFILSRDCHLIGGFAFYAWFAGEHEGDFVQTLGGYHPKYQKPSHYPDVPRLGFKWQVTDELSIKGGIYFALTSHVLMAGGYLEANYEDGKLKAWFKVGADFLIVWKPFHYDAELYLDLGGSYDTGIGTISVDVSADLHIWGPEFAGKAKIDLTIVSVEVSFGDSSSNVPQPIDWNTFRTSFLPSDDAIVGITLEEGLLGTPDPTNNPNHIDWIVNPKRIVLTTNSIIPSNHYKIDEEGTDATEGTVPFGLAPMAIPTDKVTSTQQVEIKNDRGELINAQFDFTHIPKKMPAALWGSNFQAGVNDQGYIDNALGGFRIIPKREPDPAFSEPIERKRFQFSTDTMPDLSWDEQQRFIPDQEKSEADRTLEINGAQSNATRNTILAELGISLSEINLNATLGDEFLIAPQVGNWG
jgi:hypothetical protein